MENVVTINQTQLFGLIGAAHSLNKPLFVWGSPGIGKTEITAAYAESVGAMLVDIRLGQYEAVDLRGLPDVIEGETVWCVASTIPFKNSRKGWPTDRPIIVMLDEAMHAKHDVQAVAMQMVNERRVGEHQVMDNVWFMAASNRETDRAGVNKMLTPLANRFMHAQMVPILDAFKDWAQTVGFHLVPLAYLNSRPGFLDMFTEAQKSNLKAFGTPRTWKIVSDIFHAHEKDPAMLEVMTAATVGTAVAAELMQFSRMWRTMPTMEQIKADPEGTVVPDQNDERYCVATMLANRCTPEHSQAVIQYIKRYPQQYQVLFMTDYTRRDASAVVNDAPMLEYQTSLHSAIYG